MDKVQRVGAPVCVGLDPVYDRLPVEVKGDTASGAPQDAQACVQAIHAYCRGVIDAVSPHVACVKLQSACFERYLWLGVESYHRLVRYAQQRGLIVIGDVKRSDIHLSASHYAAGCLGETRFKDIGNLTGPDAVTVSPYMGQDALAPFLQLAEGQGKGVFALVRTSNPGGDAVQSLRLENRQTVAQAVAQLIATVGSDTPLIGHTGYSSLGAVVGATKPDDIASLRRAMPQQIFLVPGYGAQGGSARAVRACFNPDGHGAIITASRSVIYAYEQPNADKDWRKAIEQAALAFKQQIAALLG